MINDCLNGQFLSIVILIFLLEGNWCDARCCDDDAMPLTVNAAFKQRVNSKHKEGRDRYRCRPHGICKVTVFLLKGKVQGVKMRRYVGIAVRYFGVGAGYAICVDDESQFRSFWGCVWRSRKKIVAAAIVNGVEADFEALHVAWCMGNCLFCFASAIIVASHYCINASQRGLRD